MDTDVESTKQKQKSIHFWDTYHQEKKEANYDKNDKHNRSISSSTALDLEPSWKNYDENRNTNGKIKIKKEHCGDDDVILDGENKYTDKKIKDESSVNIGYDHPITKSSDKVDDNNDSKEWILDSKSTIVLDAICSCLKPMLPFLTETKEHYVDMGLQMKTLDGSDAAVTSTASKTLLHIVEIGCGTSSLSRSLLQHLINRQREHQLKLQQEAGTQPFNFYITATDVSKVCIERNRRRDASFLESFSPLGSSKSDCNGCGLRYEVLDILDSNGAQLPPLSISSTTSCISGSYNNDDIPTDGSRNDNNDNMNLVNMILDKGCLDTFLFRCRTHDKSISRHPPLLTQLLNNVYEMLHVGGIYVIITPRKRITSVRDFVGFGGSVQRITINPDRMDGRGDLVGRQEESVHFSSSDDRKKHSNVYMHVCTKHSGYNPGKDKPYRDMYDTTLQDDSSICEKCGVSFLKFRGGEKMEGRGVPFWTRRWKGHKVHCQGRRSSS